jgi:CheY-like chemotaxis protein/tetratricopeptide (TPR) repeat protein
LRWSKRDLSDIFFSVLSPKVLVVEDDLHTRNIIEMVLKRDRMLRYHQLDVICAGDGEEGLALFEQHEPDLLITDLLMPKMDGFELIKAVRARSKGDLPILATSAIVRDKSVLRRLERDYNVRLQLKPFSPKVLAAQVRRLLQDLAREGEALSEAGDSDSTPPAAVAATGGAHVDEQKPEQSKVPVSSSEGSLGGRSGAADALDEPAPVGRSVSVAAPALSQPGSDSATKGEAASTPLSEPDSGELSERSVARLLLDAFEGQWSGTLEVRRGAVHKLIHLLAGYPIFVRSNLRSETLGQLLVRRGGLTGEQHESVLRTAQKHNLRYGEALVRLKLLSEEEVMAELVAQTRYKVQSCLRWRDGSWAFREEPEIGAKVPRCTVEPLEAVFSGLRRHHSVEEATSLLRGGTRRRRRHIVRLPAFERYSDAFSESFGFDLIELIGTGCPLARLAEAKGKQALAVQLDVMLQTGMVELRERPPTDLEPGGRNIPRTPSDALARVSSSVGPTPSASEMLSLKSLAEPPATIRAPRARKLTRVKPPRRRVESPEVKMARQLIEATYLGLHEKTHYEVLSIIPDTDDAGIEVAYRVKRKQFDLARFREMDLGSAYGHLEEICAALDTAYEVLRDPARRRQYKEELVRRQTDDRDAGMRAEELYHAGCQMLAQGRHDEALYALGEAIKLDEQSEYRAQEALALFFARGGGIEAAAQAMGRVRQVLAADPQQPRAHLVAAQIARAIGTESEAVQHLEEAIRIEPAFEEAFDTLEQMLLELHQVERLEEAYRRAIFLVGSSDTRWAASLWRRLSRLYREQMGNEHGARVAAEAALKLEPNDSELRFALAESNSRDPQHWPDAVRGYRSVMLQQPGNRSAVHKIFALHAGAGRTDAAFLAASAAMVRGCADGEQLRLVDSCARATIPRREGALASHTLETLVDQRQDRVLSQLFAQLAPLMVRLHPATPTQAGAAADARQASAAPGRFSQMLDYICAKLEVETPPLRLMESEVACCRLSGTARPELLVSLEALLLDEERELCFRLARALHPLRTDSLIARLSSPDLLTDYLHATLALLDSNRDVPRHNARMLQVQRELERDAKVLDRCGQIVAPLSGRGDLPEPSEWLQATAWAADRLGLLLCGDLIVSARVLADEPEAQRELVDFALSEEHERLRVELGTAVGASSAA